MGQNEKYNVWAGLIYTCAIHEDKGSQAHYIHKSSTSTNKLA